MIWTRIWISRSFSAGQALVFTENFAKEYLVEYLYIDIESTKPTEKGANGHHKGRPKLYKIAHEGNASLGFMVEGSLKLWMNQENLF